MNFTCLDFEQADKQPYIAAVDLGSNSFHLVVARIIDGDIQLLHREKQRVQLAQGLNEHFVLNEEAIERGLNALRQFADTLAPFAPDSVRVIATFTLRRAKNAATFIRRAKSIFPFPIEIISGQEEARIIYQGVAHFEHFTTKRLVIDIGGGSTEFVIGCGQQPLSLSSRNIGCVSYGNDYFSQGRISEKRFNRAILHAEQELEHIANQFKNIGWQQAVGTSGTVKAVRDIIVALGFSSNSIELDHLEALKDHFLQYTNCSELMIPGLSEDRKLLICSGLAILIAAFKQLQIQRLDYIDAALREGILYEMSDRLQHVDIRQQSVASMQRRYDIDMAQANRVSRTALALFKQVRSRWQLQQEHANALEWAANLFEVGLHINSSSVQKHSAYILQNANLPGFNQEQQLLVATLVRFHRRKIRAEEIPNFSLFQLSQVVNLIVLLRLAILLNQKRRDDFLPDISISGSAQQLHLHIQPDWLEQQSLLVAYLHSEQKQLRKIAFTLECSNLPLSNQEPA
jgi:exopolyphosphatase / guanosine-5'-triphosphate,3'-diphosphate pyrophosphatase